MKCYENRSAFSKSLAFLLTFLLCFQLLWSPAGAEATNIVSSATISGITNSKMYDGTKNVGSIASTTNSYRVGGNGVSRETKFDFGKSMLLTSVVFAGARFTSVTVVAAEDNAYTKEVATASVTWDDSATATLAEKTIVFADGPVEAQYLKITAVTTTGQSYAFYNEVEIYGQEKALDPEVIALFGGGTGTEEDPFIVSTPQQFMNMSDERVAGMSFKVTADITLPDEYEPFAFSGKLAGADASNLKTIRVHINKPAQNVGEELEVIPENVGLFSEASGGVQISNLRLTGSVTGGKFVGGFIGKAPSGTSSGAKLENCVNEADITGYEAVGGFAGRIFDGTHNITLNKLINKGSVNATVNAGGIIATSKAAITNCANLGAVTATNVGNGTAGIVGWNYGNVSFCYNSGDIRGTGNVGGIVGYHSQTSRTVASCYNNGDIVNISADGTAGGIIGAVQSGKTGVSLNNSYNTGKIGDAQTFHPVFGSGEIAITGCLYLSPSAQDDAVDGTLPKTLSELASAATDLGSAFTAPAGTYQFPEISANLNRSDYKVYTVTVTAGANGTASPAGTNYVKGGTTFTVSLLPSNAYQVAELTFNEVPVPGVSGSYTTNPITGDAVIAVTFEEKTAAPPEITTYANSFVYEEGQTGSVTFGKVVDGNGYTVEGYGILFSMTDSDPTLEKGALQLAAKEPLSANGNFGVELVGQLLSGKTYYTRAYVIYKNTDSGETKTEYGDVSVITLN